MSCAFDGILINICHYGNYKYEILEYLEVKIRRKSYTNRSSAAPETYQGIGHLFFLDNSEFQELR